MDESQLDFPLVARINIHPDVMNIFPEISDVLNDMSSSKGIEPGYTLFGSPSEGNEFFEVLLQPQSETSQGYVVRGKWIPMEEAYTSGVHSVADLTELRDRRLNFVTRSLEHLGIDPDTHYLEILDIVHAPKNVDARRCGSLWEIYRAEGKFPDPTSSRYGPGLPNTDQRVEELQREAERRKLSASSPAIENVVDETLEVVQHKKAREPYSGYNRSDITYSTPQERALCRFAREASLTHHLVK